MSKEIEIRDKGHPLSESLFGELRKEILQGNLHTGSKLSEQQICDIYGLSRTPVREALRQLEQEGLIESIPNRGAFVLGLSIQDIQDLYDMRKAFEILACEWAIQRITKVELEQLEESLEFMEFYTMRQEADKMLNINMKFHEQIYRASHNRMLTHTLSTYQFYLKQTKSNSAYLDGHLEEVLKEHQAIFEAFTKKDKTAGAAAVATHLDHAKVRGKY
jgi:DNA-binding GntR family transcriptional regulator